MTSQPLQVFDLEARLAADTNGDLLQETQNDLTAEAVDVKRHIDRGVASHEFKALTQYREALETGAAVVENVWKREHQQH